MPYGRPQFGGQPLLQRLNNVFGASANGGAPFADGIVTDFQPIATDELYTFQVLERFDRADVSGTAEARVCVEGADGLADQHLIIPGTVLPPGTNAESIYSYTSGIVACISDTAIRVSIQIAYNQGNPASDPPGAGNTSCATTQLSLTGSLWRLRYTGALGEVDAFYSGFIARGLL